MSGQFSVLSANVAGLPAIISSGNPAVNSVELGLRLNNYDLVNVQEDFNYHSELLQKNTHTYTTPTSGGVPFGSGLNTLSNFKFSDIGGLDRVKWATCSTFDGADCLTPKGFTYLQVQLADGVSVDVYNLHADAGTTDADLKARRANMDQIADYIVANSNGAAVVLFGDTNTRYTRSGDNIRNVATKTGMTDAWVANIRNGVPPTQGADALACALDATTNDCEVVDKIFFRGNRLINLDLKVFNTETKAFYDAANASLSDHAPIKAVFGWSLNDAIRASNGFGGPHGTPFTDVSVVPTAQRVVSVSLRAASRVDAVAITIGATTMAHGGTGGTLQTLTLATGEYLKSMEVHWSKYSGTTRIFYVKYTTSNGRTLAGGATSTSSTIITAPAGFQIAGFHGRSGDAVDAIGAVFTKL